MSGPSRDVVVMGGSAGSIAGVLVVMKSLAADFPARMGIVIHRPPNFDSTLATHLARHSRLPLSEPLDGDRFETGHVYLAPCDRHMILEGERIYTIRGPRQHHTRPAVDPLFESAAASYGRRVIGVLLSGNLSDGVTGLVAIKAAGGVCLAEDPQEATFPSMPLNALAYDHVDLVFGAATLGAILERLARGEAPRDLHRTNGAKLPEAGFPLPAGSRHRGQRAQAGKDKL